MEDDYSTQLTYDSVEFDVVKVNSFELLNLILKSE
jgi:hypothetical protein